MRVWQQRGAACALRGSRFREPGLGGSELDDSRNKLNFGNRLGIVVSFSWPFTSGRRDHPRSVPQLAQRPTDKVGAEARLYADDARRQLFEGLHECQALDLATKIRTEANDVEGGTPQFSGYPGRTESYRGKHNRKLLN